MELSDRTKILLVLVVILVALYVYSTSTSSNPIQNEGSLSYSRNDDNDEILSVQDGNNAISDMDQRLEAISEAKAKRKMRTRNTAEPGEFKNSSYRDGKRGGSSNDLDKFFEEGNTFDPSSSNDGFLPNDEAASSGHAPYVSSRKRSQREEDKFNSGDLLPKETNSDFFEDVQAVSVKNRHLINIFRPIGVNTVSSSRKNGTRDIRGEPANPKNFVSPFLNSSIDPGQNIVGLCGGA